MDSKQLEFIASELEDWSKWVDKKLHEQFKRLNIGVTHELERSLHYQVFKAASGSDGAYKLSFLEYGRMLDMNVGRGRSHSITGNRKKYKSATVKRWYSRTTYGATNRLIGSLVNGYVAATMATIKNPLSQAA